MEIFLITVVLVTLLACLCLNMFHFFRLSQQLKGLIEFNSRICEVLTEDAEKTVTLTNKIEATASNFDRHLLALRELLETTKPMKTNNWDSVREAFKGPTRVEINERN